VYYIDPGGWTSSVHLDILDNILDSIHPITHPRVRLFASLLHCSDTVAPLMTAGRVHWGSSTDHSSTARHAKDAAAAGAEAEAEGG
jgi:hypothetical protein